MFLVPFFIRSKSFMNHMDGALIFSGADLKRNFMRGNMLKRDLNNWFRMCLRHDDEKYRQESVGYRVVLDTYVKFTISAVSVFVYCVLFIEHTAISAFVYCIFFLSNVSAAYMSIAQMT